MSRQSKLLITRETLCFLFHAAVKIECSADSMSITLHYKDFSGRIFSIGHSDECGVNGNNQDRTTLVLPIPTDPRVEDKCGVFVAYSVGNGNR